MSVDRSSNDVGVGPETVTCGAGTGNGIQSDLAITDRAIADTLLYRTLENIEVSVPAKLPCYTGCQYNYGPDTSYSLNYT